MRFQVLMGANLDENLLLSFYETAWQRPRRLSSTAGHLCGRKLVRRPQAGQAGCKPDNPGPISFRMRDFPAASCLILPVALSLRMTRPDCESGWNSWRYLRSAHIHDTVLNTATSYNGSKYSWITGLYVVADVIISTGHSDSYEGHF